MEMYIGSYRIVVERTQFSTTELRQRYDHLAAGWGQVVEKLGYARAYQRLFQKIKKDGYLNNIPRNNSVIMDSGIGSGDLSLALSKTLGQPLSIDGVDISAEMLAQASDRLTANGDFVNLHQANVTELPFNSHQYDLVMSAHTLEHLDSPESGLVEMVRVAKPNGLLLVIVTKPSLWGRWIQYRWGIQLLGPYMLAAKLHALGVTDMRGYLISSSVWSFRGSAAIIGRIPPSTPQ
ncbi:MAG: class I SAM-dependent methyltransferase [Chloroflexota bacterium]